MLISALNIIQYYGLVVLIAKLVPVQVFFRLQRVSLIITLFVRIRLFGLKVPFG